MADAVESLIEGFEETLRSTRDAEWPKYDTRWPSLPAGEPRRFGALMARNIEAYLKARENRAVDDAVDFIAGQFALELRAILDENPAAISEFLSMGALEIGAHTRESAADLIAPILWRNRIGHTLETGDVVHLLDVSRQAIHKQVRAGKLLGLPGNRTTLFPDWQFDIERRTVRQGVSEVLATFRDRLGDDVDPLLIASWATTRQYEDLDGRTPGDAFRDGPDSVVQLIASADRTAARLAQ